MTLNLPLLTRSARRRGVVRRRGRTAYEVQVKDFSVLPTCGSSMRPLASQLSRL